MSYRRLAVVLAVLTAVTLFSQISWSQAKEPRKVRMGYFEGGKYPYHDRLKDEFLRQLEAILPDSIEAVFAPEGYRCAEWEKGKSSQLAKELSGVETIDLVVGAGPWVIKDLIEAGYKKPIVGIHQFTPQFEGLLDKKGKAIASNLTLHYQKNKIESDLTKLSQMVRLRKLGLLVFPSSTESDSILALAQAVGKKLGFEVVTAFGQNNKGTFAFFNAYGSLDKKIDALYIGPMWGCDIKMINQFFYNTEHNKIPVMTSEDKFLVERGALLTNNAYGLYAEARFSAYKAAQIILGKKPGSLQTEFSVDTSTAINEAAAIKYGVPLDEKFYSEAFVVPAPPNENTNILRLVEAIGRAVTINPGDLDKRETIALAVQKATREYREFFPDYSRDSISTDMRRKLFSSAAIEATQATLKSNSPQLALEQAVTNAFLNYLVAEEVLSVELRIRELVIRNVEVSREKYLAEKSGDKELKRWGEEQLQSTRGIVEAQKNRDVARTLLNLVMSYSAEQKLSAEGDRFGVDATQKFCGHIYQSLTDSTKIDSIETKLRDLGGEKNLEGFQKILSGFDNLVIASRQVNDENLGLQQAVAQYDAGKSDIDDMIYEIGKVKGAQLNEVSGRYGFYMALSDICYMLGWSSFDTGESFTNRVEKLLVKGE